MVGSENYNFSSYLKNCNNRNLSLLISMVGSEKKNIAIFQITISTTRSILVFRKKKSVLLIRGDLRSWIGGAIREFAFRFFFL